MRTVHEPVLYRVSSEARGSWRSFCWDPLSPSCPPTIYQGTNESPHHRPRIGGPLALVSRTGPLSSGARLRPGGAYSALHAADLIRRSPVRKRRATLSESSVG